MTELKESDISPAPIKNNHSIDFGQVSKEDSETPGALKRGRGRPRKYPVTPGEISKPPQSSSLTEEIEKRKRGRPRKNTDESASLNGDNKSDVADSNELEEYEPNAKRRQSSPSESSSYNLKKDVTITENINSVSQAPEPPQTTMAIKMVDPNTVNMESGPSELMKPEGLVGPSLIEMTRGMSEMPSSPSEADAIRAALQEVGVEH